MILVYFCHVHELNLYGQYSTIADLVWCCYQMIGFQFSDLGQMYDDIKLISLHCNLLAFQLLQHQLTTLP